jgi:uncharacterized damage-inducible protein DinB
MSRTLRPEPTEFSPYYAGYVARVPDGDIIETLRSQEEATVGLARSLAEEKGSHRYAPGKWSIRQVLGHMADTERIMAYRALRAARGDATPLPGFDENLYVQNARFDERSLASLSDELALVRQGTLAVLAPLNEQELGRAGSANGSPITARALAWIIAGHERHHLAILRERYL